MSDPANECLGVKCGSVSMFGSEVVRASDFINKLLEVDRRVWVDKGIVGLCEALGMTRVYTYGDAYCSLLVC